MVGYITLFFQGLCKSTSVAGGQFQRRKRQPERSPLNCSIYGMSVGYGGKIMQTKIVQW